MKKQLFLFLLIVSHLGLLAQSHVDSLWTVWEDQTVPDSLRLKALDDIVYDVYMYSQPDSALYWSKVLYDYASEKGNKKYMAIALSNKGQAHDLQGNYQQALELYTKSYDLQEEISSDRGMASALNNMGIVYMEQSNYPEALERFLKSLKLFEKISDKGGMANTLGNIGIIYLERKDLVNALDYNQRSLLLYEETSNAYGVASSSLNIGLVYLGQKKYDKALEYFIEGRDQFEKISNDYGSSYALKNIASIYNLQGDHTKAILVYQESLDLSKRISERSGIASSSIDIGKNYIQLMSYSKSISWCEKGLKIAEEIGAVNENKDACECLYDAYKAMGKSNEALKYHERLTVLKDSLFNEENTKKLTQLGMQYEFDKKEETTLAEQEKKDLIAAQELRRQKLVRNGFMGGFAVVFLFAGVFFVQRNRISKEKERSEELLLNILPEETAQELKEKGHSDAQLIDQVTVLFTDFEGFTALSEKLSPKKLVQDLHACFSQFDHICEKYGIEKIKTIGDSYMAAGGLPVPNSTHAKDVVKAALEMAEIVEKGKMKKIEGKLPFFEMRIGVHTGPVVAGIVGIKKFQYDIWGDTVNTASRMESSGSVGQVNISQTTYKLLKDDTDFTFESRGKIEAKGKGEIEMYFTEHTGKS